MSDTPLTNQHRSRLRTVAESTAFEEELERRLNACVEALEKSLNALPYPSETGPQFVARRYAQQAIANAKKPL